MKRFTQAVAALVWISTPALAQSPGPVFAVGGGPQPPALVREFVDLAGGPGKARIVVMAMASESGATSGEEKAADLRALGAEARNVWLTREQADTDSAARLLDGATGIWFGGGDQSRLMAAIGGTRTAAAIHARWRAGAVVGGTSAGAAVLSTPMITGDEKRPGGDRPADDGSVTFATLERDNVITTAGLGVLTNVIIDQHFVRRKRHNRLISLVLEGPVRLGAGIDESTALVIEPSGQWRVSGAGTVVIYDARDAATATGALLTGIGLRLHVLPAGGRFDPVTGRATLP